MRAASFFSGKWICSPEFLVRGKFLLVFRERRTYNKKWKCEKESRKERLISMRKKSHISLAKYMVDNLNDEGLRRHKLSFYVGSILPDIKPSFVYKRHEIEGTFPLVKKHIKRLSEGPKAIEKKGRKYYMDLGQVSHYLADYFTFPHNHSYSGSLADHCSYEKKLKNDLKSYIKSDPSPDFQKSEYFHSAEALCSFIQKAHDEYIPHRHDVEDDIRHIIDVNCRALAGMITLLARRSAEHSA